MSDNIIKSSYDKAYVSKKVEEKVDDNIISDSAEKNKEQQRAKSSRTTKKTSAKTENKKKDDPKEVALFSEGKIAHPALGRLDKGYNIVDPETAKEWLAISNRVREATPEEVAIAYGA